MKVIVSFYYMGEVSPVLVILDLANRSLVKTITYDRIGKAFIKKSGIRGVTFNRDIIYFANNLILFRTDFNFKDINQLPVGGRDIHQIEYSSELDGVLICSTGENAVKLYRNNRIHYLFSPVTIGKDMSHINSITFRHNIMYVTGFFQGDSAVIDWNFNKYATGLKQAHNICLFQDGVLVCDSYNEQVHYFRDNQKILSYNCGGFTKGLAVSDEHILVGTAIREAGKSYISILDFNFNLIDRIKFSDIDNRLYGHPYDIRIIPD